MTPLSTLPSAREQARHALILLGTPAPARLVVAVHRALFDGDLDMPAVAGLLRAERRVAAPVVCHGLTPCLAPIHVALTQWPLERRIVTPAIARANLSSSVGRIRGFVAIRPGASRAAAKLLAALDDELTATSHLPSSPDVDLAEVGLRAEARTERERWFGVPTVPHPRAGGSRRDGA
jgi:hypothetical protein